MTQYFDNLETRSADARASALAQDLPAAIATALRAPGMAAHLGAVDPAEITDRAALARLPVLRTSDLGQAQ
jgi:phenylacetate-CoA ligase